MPAHVVDPNPRWASPTMPLTCGYWPVPSAARLPEQVGAAAKAWRKITPSSARRWMRGVRTPAPVGLDVPAGVVRVEVEDVGRHDGFPIELV